MSSVFKKGYNPKNESTDQDKRSKNHNDRCQCARDFPLLKSFDGGIHGVSHNSCGYKGEEDITDGVKEVDAYEDKHPSKDIDPSW